MNTPIDEATLQFLHESEGLFDDSPMFGVSAEVLVFRIKSNRASISDLLKAPEWQRIYTLLIKKSGKEPSWWHTPLGNYAAKNLPFEDKTITKAEAARMLGGEERDGRHPRSPWHAALRKRQSVPL